MAQRRASDQPPGKKIMRAQTLGNLAESIMDSEVVPSSLDEIAPILRVANEVEAINPRVAYLCKLQQLCLEIWNSFKVLLSSLIQLLRNYILEELLREEN